MSGIYTFRKLVLLVLGICWLNTLGAAEPEKVVYKVDIKDEIGPEVWRLARKSFDLAGQEKADYILIHMNTYGGMVVYADSLRSMILNSRKPVWVFIDNNAASAGALISIACDKIYMREGANIGAATVVNQTGEAMPDKYPLDDSFYGRSSGQGYVGSGQGYGLSLEAESAYRRSHGGSVYLYPGYYR